MSVFSVSKSVERGELIFTGALTIENASAIRRKLIATLMREDKLVVCIDTDASVDISFLQLLCSAHRIASTLSKEFTVRHLDSDNFISAVENAGYTRKKGCSRGRGESCLWVGGVYD